MPILSNHENHDHWPKVVSNDVTEHVNALSGNVFVISGQAKGKTLLPLPVGAEKLEDYDVEFE